MKNIKKYTGKSKISLDSHMKYLKTKTLKFIKINRVNNLDTQKYTVKQEIL